MSTAIERFMTDLLLCDASYCRSHTQGETIGQKRDLQLRPERDVRGIPPDDRDLVLSDDAAIGHQDVSETRSRESQTAR
jgi:hypothetical protein